MNTIEDVMLAVNAHLVETEQTQGSSLRLSSAGTCARKLAWANHLWEEIPPISSRAASIFALGHLLHDAERDLIREVAPLVREEERVYLKIPDLTQDLHQLHPIVHPQTVRNGNGYTLMVPGHVDGVLEFDDGPVLVDIKTTSTRSFGEMVKEGPSYEYRAQLNAYMEATGIHQAWLWLYNKETSHRAAVPVPYDPRIVEEVKARFRRAALATPDNPPPREYAPKQELRKKEPTGREYLPWQCSYCSFTSRCWSSEGFEMVLENNKPRWLRNTTSEELELV